MKHASIPIFVPHLACPNDCVFCNQKKIAGTEKPISDIEGFLKAATEKLSDKFDEIDIAFFGGSFTGLSKSEMDKYLRPAYELRKNCSRITGIRLSTRPDYISQDILDFLRTYDVTAIELGAQSMDERVLRASRRGHTATDTERASQLIKNEGFELILQFMPGLPQDTQDSIAYTIDQVAQLRPDGVRIYPCVVIKDTYLETMYLKGEYTPLTVDRAAEICADATELFAAMGIKVIRTGLHSSDLVRSGSVLAGPFHPAFGEIVSQKIYLRRARHLLAEYPTGEQTVLYVKPGCVSKMTGQKRSNILQLQKEFKTTIIIKENPRLNDYETERS